MLALHSFWHVRIQHDKQGTRDFNIPQIFVWIRSDYNYLRCCISSCRCRELPSFRHFPDYPSDPLLLGLIWIKWQAEEKARKNVIGEPKFIYPLVKIRIYSRLIFDWHVNCKLKLCNFSILLCCIELYIELYEPNMVFLIYTILTFLLRAVHFFR